MKQNSLVALMTIILFSLLSSGCKDTTTVKVTSDKDPMMDHTKDSMPPHDMDNMNDGLMQSMTMMMKDMEGMKMSGDFDQDFANMMILHHQGAVKMSEVELAKGTDPQIKAMAQKIISSQNAEINKFREILASYSPVIDDNKHGESHNELSESMNSMMAGMKGMQMTGNVDKDFVMMMIPHHESAITMAEHQISHGNVLALKQMAQKIMTDQAKEIAEFKSWLAAH